MFRITIYNMNIYFKVVEVQIQASERIPMLGRDPSHPMFRITIDMVHHRVYNSCRACIFLACCVVSLCGLCLQDCLYSTVSCTNGQAIHRSKVQVPARAQNGNHDVNFLSQEASCGLRDPRSCELLKNKKDHISALDASFSSVV
jgi:hypothetical protein